MTGMMLALVLATAAPAAPQAMQTDKADELKAKALELMTERRHWDEAAELWVRSAREREAADPERDAALGQAAVLFYYLGEFDESLELFGRAAAGALERGAIAMAAKYYLDGAQVAAHGGNRDVGESLIERARLLAGSPHLTAPERAAIEARLPDAPATIASR
ncbi:MAG: hypothetical protein ACRELV_03190 [Longimicrobiales bacterium]